MGWALAGVGVALGGAVAALALWYRAIRADLDRLEVELRAELRDARARRVQRV
jgi:hypothetical protein